MGEDVPAEHLAELFRRAAGLPGDQLGDPLHGGRIEPRVREGGQVLRVRQRQAVVDRAEEVAGRLPVLADHRVAGERGAEDLLGDVADRLGAARRLAQGRAGGHGADPAERPARLGVPGGGGQPAQQHRDVGALRAVVGVELVDHHVPDVGVPPQRQVVGALQQQVEHLVVGDQDVRGVPADVGPFGQHPGVGGVRPLADVQARRDAGQVVRRQELVDPVRLVGGEGVHRVQQDRLDARRARLALAAAVVQDGDQERLGLAGPGAGGDQRRLGVPVLAVQAAPRLDLVLVRDRVVRRPLQDLPPVRARVRERGPDPQVRPAEHALPRVVQEPLKPLPGGLVRQGERRGEVLGKVPLELLGGQGRSHDAAPFMRSVNAACACRYSPIRSAL